MAQTTNSYPFSIAGRDVQVTATITPAYDYTMEGQPMHHPARVEVAITIPETEHSQASLTEAKKIAGFLNGDVLPSVVSGVAGVKYEPGMVSNGVGHISGKLETNEAVDTLLSKVFNAMQLAVERHPDAASLAERTNETLKRRAGHAIVKKIHSQRRDRAADAMGETSTFPLVSRE